MTTKTKVEIAHEAVEKARLHLASVEGTLAHVEWAMQSDETLNLGEYRDAVKADRDMAQAALTEAQEALRRTEQEAN